MRLDALTVRIHERVAGVNHADAHVTVVPVTAAGSESVTEIDADGVERAVMRPREPDVGLLVAALNDAIRADAGALETLRRQAVFQLAADKLSAAEADFRQRRSEEIIRQYTRKAVVGALAAVSPGSDIVIQGYLGTGLVKTLSGLYGRSARDVDVEEFLNLSQSRVGKAVPLTLAVAGNGLKAFPGIGTVAGGLVHAIAYGLIFDALGRSLAQSLASGAGFSPERAAATFGDSLNDDLERRVARIARLALTAGDERPGTKPD